MVDYDASIDELTQVVQSACEAEDSWQAKVASGTSAAIDFATANPRAALALTARGGETDHAGDRYRQTVAHFASMLAEVAPRDRRLPASIDEALVAGIASVVADHLRRDRADRVPEIRPDLVQFALLPFVGFDEARQWVGETEKAP
jgi:hypothetical protein